MKLKLFALILISTLFFSLSYAQVNNTEKRPKERNAIIFLPYDDDIKVPVDRNGNGFL